MTWHTQKNWIDQPTDQTLRKRFLIFSFCVLFVPHWISWQTKHAACVCVFALEFYFKWCDLMVERIHTSHSIFPTKLNTLSSEFVSQFTLAIFHILGGLYHYLYTRMREQLVWGIHMKWVYAVEWSVHLRAWPSSWIKTKSHFTKFMRENFHSK